MRPINTQSHLSIKIIVFVSPNTSRKRGNNVIDFMSDINTLNVKTRDHIFNAKIGDHILEDKKMHITINCKFTYHYQLLYDTNLVSYNTQNLNFDYG